MYILYLPRRACLIYCAGATGNGDAPRRRRIITYHRPRPRRRHRRFLMRALLTVGEGGAMRPATLTASMMGAAMSGLRVRCKMISHATSCRACALWARRHELFFDAARPSRGLISLKSHAGKIGADRGDTHDGVFTMPPHFLAAITSPATSPAAHHSPPRRNDLRPMLESF